MLGTGIYILISTNSAIEALIGTRIYPVTLPDAAIMPAMTYAFMGGSSNPTLDTSGMQRVRVQFDAWGKTALDVDVLTDTLRKLLNGYQGTLADGTVIQNVDLVNAEGLDSFDYELLQYRRMIEFYFYFTFNS